MTVGFWFCRSAAQLFGDWICRASDAIKVLQLSKLTLHDAPSVCASLTGERWTVKKEVDVCFGSMHKFDDFSFPSAELGRLTCKRRDNGTHSLKVSLERKFLKKAGQEVVVKLFPKAVSKGIGSASEDAVEAEEAEEDVDVARLRRCCRYGSGGVLLSKSRTLSVLVRACVTWSS